MPKEKKVSKKKKSSAPVKTPSSNSTNKRPLVIEREDKKLPYRLTCRIKMYALDEELAEEIRNNIGRSFEPGNVISGRKSKYTVVKKIGIRTYIVESKESREPLIMKTEAALLPPDGPILKRELLFLTLAREKLKSTYRTHFMNIVDQSDNKYKSSFSAIFMNKAKYSLADVREKVLNGAEFTPQTALRLCLVTLQAIHDVHLNNYVHRDIQPKNFFIGHSNNKGISSIYISGFAYSYDKKHRDSKKGLPSFKKLAKTSFMSSVFQTRSYHKHENMTEKSVDMESWIFLCYDFFNSKALFWNRATKLSEREYLNHKRAFFSGAYDTYFDQLGIPPILNVLKRAVFQLGSREAIDYPYYAHLLMLIAKNLKIDWNSKYEWQTKMSEGHSSKELRTIDEEKSDEEDGSKSPPSRDSAPSSDREELPPMPAEAKGKKRTSSKRLRAKPDLPIDSTLDESHDQEPAPVSPSPNNAQFAEPSKNAGNKEVVNSGKPVASPSVPQTSENQVRSSYFQLPPEKH